MKILSCMVILIIFTSSTWSFSIFKDDSKEKLEKAKDSATNDIQKQLDSIKIDQKLPGFTPSQVKCKLKEIFKNSSS